MPDLNRVPQNLPDAAKLIEELRDEIRRRPTFLAITQQAEPELRIRFDDAPLLKAARTYKIAVGDDQNQIQFAAAVCVETQEDQVSYQRFDTTGKSSIICTETNPKQRPAGWFSVQLRVHPIGELDSTKFMMRMPPVDDRAKHLIAAELRRLADKIDADCAAK